MPNDLIGQMVGNDCLMGLVRKWEGMSLHELIEIIVEGGRNRNAVVLSDLTMGHPSKKEEMISDKVENA